MPTNQRVQVGDLSGPSQIRPQGVMPDTYSRPRKDANAGSLLGQLSEALGTLRPGVAAISQVLAQDYNEQEFVSGQQFREHLKEANQVDKSGWSRSRLQGYEMADATITASQLPFAYEGALRKKGLWDNATVHPEEVQKVFAEVRSKYASKGEGRSPVWTKTFEQQRQGFENGVMNRWLQNANQIREQTARDDLVTHTSQQVAGAVQLQDTAEANTRLHAYLDESFRNVSVDAPSFNRSVATGFYNAYRQAITSQDFTSADRIRAMATGFETKEGQKLFETSYGANILEQMDKDRHAAVAGARQVERQIKEQAIEGLQVAQWEFVKPYIGKPSSQWPTDLPMELYDAAGPLGQADNMRKSFLDWKSNYDSAKTEGPEAASALADIERDSLFADSSESLASLKRRLLDVGYRYNGPEFIDKLKKVSDMLTAKETEFGPSGRFSSPVFQEGKAQWSRQRSALLGTYRAELREVYDTAKQSRQFFHIPGVEINPDAQGNVDFFLPDLEPKMDSYLSSYLGSVVQSRGGSWRTLTMKDMSEAIKATSEEFKPQIEEKAKELRKAIQQQQEELNATPTVGPPKDLFPGDTPNADLVQRIQEQRSSLGHWLGSRTEFAGPIVRSGGGVRNSPSLFRDQHDNYDYKKLFDSFMRDPQRYVSGIVPSTSIRDRLGLVDQSRKQELRQQAWDVMQAELTTQRLEAIKSLTQLENEATKGALKEFAAGRNPGRKAMTELMKWSDARQAFYTLAQAKPVTPEEFSQMNPRWLLDGDKKYPTKVLLVDREDKLTVGFKKKIMKTYELNQQEYDDFLATQLELLSDTFLGRYINPKL